MVNIWGQVVSISGQPVTVSVATNISGQVVVPVSGQSFGFIWDYSGLTWTQAATSNSGTNKLLVDAGSISVASNISGQVVQFASGGNTVTIASGAVVQISGQTVVATANANISGQAVFLGSGSVLGLSGLPVSTSVSGNA